MNYHLESKRAVVTGGSNGWNGQAGKRINIF